MNRTTHRPTLEQLDLRRMFAGDVTANLVGGQLWVLGDDAANTVSIESAGHQRIAVRGFHTSVNGQQNAVAFFDGAPGSIKINLRGGHDLVRITNLVAPGNLQVAVASGDDEVVLGRDKLRGEARFGGSPAGPLYVAGNVAVFAGAGNDLVYQSDAHMEGEGVVSLGAGDDTLFVQRPAGSSANVDYGGDLSILPAEGDDVVDLLGLTVAGDLAVRDGQDRHYLVARSLDVHGQFRVKSAALADRIDITATNVRQQLSIDSGAGNDRMRISAIVSRLNVNLGSGDDGLEIASAQITRTVVAGGDGDDVFFARYLHGVDAFFTGDGGRDVLRTSKSLPNQLSALRKETLELSELLI
jgi:hypothetical protein